jgi:tetratricopeptide (TPR) repeat protein
VAADPLALADAVAALRRYSLVRMVADGLFVHRLLQTVVRGALDAETERTWAAAAVRLVRVSFPFDSDEVANWAECERLLPHGLTVAHHGERLEVEPEAWLRLWGQVALYLWARGQYRQALKLFEQAAAGFERVLGDDHPDTLTVMNNVAATRRALGDLHGAHDLHEQTLTARRRVLGEDHPDTLASMNNLASTRRALGDLQGAHDLFEQALAGRRRVLGDDHPDTVQSMNYLAETRHQLEEL